MFTLGKINARVIASNELVVFPVVPGDIAA